MSFLLRSLAPTPDQTSSTPPADVGQAAIAAPSAVGTAPSTTAQPVPVVGGVAVPLNGVPQTRQELAALRSRRSELSDQLQSATSRRNALASRLRTADGADRVGLEQHLRMLDGRILQLETDIALTGQQVAAVPATLLSSSSTQAGGGDSRDRRNVGLSVLFMLGILMPMALAFSRLLWRRATRPSSSRQDADTAQRLIRLETAVDSIAEEVERVSEGQRFVTKLLSEAHVTPRVDAGREAAPVSAAGQSLGGDLLRR